MPTTPCSWCDQPTTRICSICSRPTCPDHLSGDGELCLECTTDDTKAVEKTTGLVDQDGDNHPDVTVLRPVGAFYLTTTGAIAKFSDKELDHFIDRYGMLIRDCEAAGDRYRIIHSAARMEKEERARAVIREARAYKAAPTTANKVASAIKDSPSDLKLAVLATMLKRGGMTKEKLQALISKAKEKKLNGTKPTNSEVS